MRRTSFIHVSPGTSRISVAELEMQEGSYQGDDVTFCDSHGFSSLTVLRIDTLDTLKRVVGLHSADSRRNEAIKPTFVDMDMPTITALSVTRLFSNPFVI